MKFALLFLLLLPIQSRADCPGLKLSASCGNQKCEASLGETADTCPLDCTTAEIHSYNLQTICTDATQIVVPENLEAASRALKGASASGLSVRIVGKRHSVTSQLCTRGLILVTEKLNRILGLETIDGVQTVAVEGGVTFGEVNEWLDSRQLSLGYAYPAYRGISVAGALSTGSHGDSMKHPAVVASIAEAVTVVLSSGEVRELRRGQAPSDEFRAATVSLGMLGLVAKVNLRIRERFKIRMRMTPVSDKFLFEEGGIERNVSGCDTVRIHWFPNRGRVFTFCGTEAPERAEDPGADNRALYPESTLEEVAKIRKNLQQGACSPIFNGALELINRIAMRLQPPFGKRDPKTGKFGSSRDVTGPSHHILAGEVNPYVSSLPNMDYSITIPFDGAHRALQDFATLAKVRNLFFPMNGVALRFMPSDDSSFLADSAAGSRFQKGRPTVNFEFNVYRPLGFDPDRMKAWLSPYEDLARMLIHDHGGRAHWGKNVEALFAYEKEQSAFGDLYSRFAAVEKVFDPKGVFKNPFSGMVGL